MYQTMTEKALLTVEVMELPMSFFLFIRSIFCTIDRMDTES